MKNVLGFKCVECAREHAVDAVEYNCPSCGGNLDVVYDYRRISSAIGKAQLARDSNHTIWRYRPLLPVDEKSRVPPIPVGWTPVHNSTRLAAEFGIRQVLIKDDGRNPTASFKDRPSALAVVKALEKGARVITTASSGNAGVALAGMSASIALRSVVFVPVDTPPAKLVQLRVYGATVARVEGSYDEAYDLCLQAATRYGWYQRSTGFNPFMTEGKKTAAFEIAEQLEWDLPDKIFVPVGDGCIIGGLWKGFNDLKSLGLVDRLPQLMAVQAEGASAIVDAANGDGILRAAPAPRTVADSICVGRPRDATKAIRAIRHSGGRGLKVPDREIVSAIGRLARAAGIFAEPAAAASFAGLVGMCAGGGIRPEDRVLLLITGNGLKAIEAVQGTLEEAPRVPPDINAFAKIFESGPYGDLTK